MSASASNPTFFTVADLRNSEQAHRAATIHDLAVDHQHYSNIAAIKQSDFLVVGNRIAPRTVPSGPMRPIFDTTREIRKDYYSTQRSADSTVFEARAADTRRGPQMGMSADNHHRSRFISF